jgi:hypothetical protein
MAIRGEAAVDVVEGEVEEKVEVGFDEEVEVGLRE